MFIVYLPRPPQGCHFTRAGSLLLAHGCSCQSNCNCCAAGLGMPPPPWQTPTHVALKYLLKCHPLGEGFPACFYTRPSTSDTAGSLRTGVFSAPEDAALNATSKSLNCVSRVARVEMCCILFLNISFFFLFWQYPRHAEVPRPGI